jgi:sec-independent protein translocase protein TatC
MKNPKTALDQWTENYSENNSDEENEMSFLDHLEELRWHIIRSLIAIIVFSIASFAGMNYIFNILILGPTKTTFWTYRMLCKLADAVKVPSLCVDKLDFILINRDPAGQFMMSITLSLIIGVVCAFPYAFWELWRFVKPGLRPEERKAASGATFYVSLLFGLGVLFGYFIVVPLVIQFLANYKLDPSIANQFDLSAYISMVSTLALGCGLMFQLPMVAFVLSKVGLITPQFLRTYRRHAAVVILVVAAIITPSPDVMSQLIVSFPLFILYEISIGVSARVWKKKKQQEIE